ncbi:MAG: GntR family transcriptional regulator [Clostridia bacterium]|nr:GntR family transcriptional regulator [Lachnospiraceae bacterium]NCC01491.1 GntR family transcriptional regulator [Clostridia bacterium]NCD03266.1 GntR family transcriptional regulator [Clostridia bacterium]
MIVKIDFNSDEAIYIQLRNQIIMGIATSQLSAGDSLPSVRQLADYVGINMHTVNKAYSVLKQEGYIKLDRRKGAVVALDYDQVMASQRIMDMLQSVLAEAICKNVGREEVHDMVDEIYDFFTSSGQEDYHPEL